MALAAMTAPRVLFHVQHLLGIGHLARASRIAAALSKDGFDVTVVTGGPPVAGFPGLGLKTIALPAVRAGASGFSALIDEHGAAIGDSFKARRRELLLAVLGDIRPDIVMLEAFPFGRRQMRFELLPLLETAMAMRPRPLIVSSVRDIVQESRKAGRAEETVGLVERCFDAVLVHGDRRFARLEESFPPAAAIAKKLAYTGLVAGPQPQPARDRFDVVVSAGGGAAGLALLEAAAALAMAGRWCVITGPNLPTPSRDAVRALAAPGVSLFEFRQDFPGLLARARLSLSQAGYNTVCDILRTQCRSVLVPFAQAGETEQSFRAARLATLGLARVVAEADVATPRLAEAIETALNAPPPLHDLDLDGARRTAEVLRAML